MDKTKIGFAITGSFCTFSKAILMLEELSKTNYDIIPILSENASNTDTRFFKAKDFIKKIEELTGKQPLINLTDVEPIGPKKLLDLLIIAPCTGNTLAKINYGIADTSVTMATKSHLRNNRPVLIGVSTNDGLSNSAKNIGFLLNKKNIYFIPFKQDDPIKKSNSIISNFNLLIPAIEKALSYEQIQPILL